MAYTSDLIPVMTSNTEPKGVASASSELSGAYAAWKAMDHVSPAGNCWATSAQQSGWLKYQFDSAKIITQYKITIEDNPVDIDRAPKSWTFQGSNNDSDWVTLDTQSNITDWVNHETKVFPISNTNSYLYYRLNISENNGDTYLTIAEWEMMANATTENKLKFYRRTRFLGNITGL